MTSHKSWEAIHPSTKWKLHQDRRPSTTTQKPAVAIRNLLRQQLYSLQKYRTVTKHNKWGKDTYPPCHKPRKGNQLNRNNHDQSNNLLTYSMAQSSSWKGNQFAASQEIPRISRNPKFHYRTHKRPPPVSILGQPNTVHIPTSHLLEIHPNIIHPSTQGNLPYKDSLTFQVPNFISLWFLP